CGNSFQCLIPNPHNAGSLRKHLLGRIEFIVISHRLRHLLHMCILHDSLQQPRKKGYLSHWVKMKAESWESDVFWIAQFMGSHVRIYAGSDFQWITYTCSSEVHFLQDQIRLGTMQTNITSEL
ncbi:hypothetical protein HispidOSU_013403, partial [Sigmodon hispidus]